MRKEVIGICPVCQNQLVATRLTCLSCHTEINGEFSLSRFSYLSRDELQFVETFVRVSGNIKEMEKEFGVSYPTVKKNLDIIIQKMGFPVQRQSETNQQEVLEQIRKGEISVEDALILLKNR